MLQCASAPNFVEDKPNHVFGTIHFDNNSILSCTFEADLLLIRATQRYLLNPERAKKERMEGVAFYAAAKRYINAVRNLFLEVSSTNRKKFASDGFSGPLTCDAPYTQTTTRTVVEAFFNYTKQSKYSAHDNKRQLELAAATLWKSSIVRNKAFFKLDFPTTVATSQQLEQPQQP